MLGIPLRYLLTHPLAATDLLADPVGTSTNFVDMVVAYRERSRPECPYTADEQWEERLHAQLGLAWPCAASAEFQRVWTQVMTELEAKGIRPGPESFDGWNDGDAGLVRAIWCLTRHLRPPNVVETGVGHGVTSRLILEAMQRNEGGHLWSIDLPPIEKAWHKQVAMAVDGRYPEQWTYLKGSSRRHLPTLLSRLGRIKLFIHDSLHSERNLRFELDRAWAALEPGGVMVVDDVDANWGFHSFTETFSPYAAMVCPAEPLHPDRRRSNQKGLFGIILKEPLAARKAA